MKYKATHISKRDGSDVMLVSTRTGKGGEVYLKVTNEDGYIFEVRASDWQEVCNGVH